MKHVSIQIIFCFAYTKILKSFKILRYEEGEDKEEVGWHKVKFNKLENGYEVTTNGYVEATIFTFGICLPIFSKIFGLIIITKL